MTSCWPLLLLLLSACASAHPAAYQQATLLADKARYLEAAALLRSYLAESPGAVRERRLLVRILAAAGRMDHAASQVEQLRRVLGPADPTPWIELGHAFELDHDYDRALASYDRAAELAPKHPAGPLTGGLRAARWGEIELAAPRLEEALRRDPTDPAAWHALGLVRLHLGDPQGARLAYESGLQADPRAVDNRIGLATLALSDNDLNEALEQYDRILEDRPKFGDAHLGRSFVLIKLRRFEEARRALEMGYRLGANPVVVSRQRALIERLQIAR